MFIFMGIGLFIESVEDTIEVKKSSVKDDFVLHEDWRKLVMLHNEEVQVLKNFT